MRKIAQPFESRSACLPESSQKQVLGLESEANRKSPSSLSLAPGPLAVELWELRGEEWAAYALSSVPAGEVSSDSGWEALSGQAGSEGSPGWARPLLGFPWRRRFG